ncbi:molybdenum cofactor biosynthesis protein MoaE [Alicyclobacillus mengziensis]|uniref:Molybdenum cofactor biosynthesis protein MoaE n=1 Tax=Alicyclobacillus mengziensis TaxID=2931921 RepID=A0A9X7VXX0_9BACL|nr:molybdenum cofactor biosynthesis protein MoaE [Alicyclobacillus mengziensis]QSO45803.1 molybdenum cofactor biosynthesis protein MoaE [Alicyclobacillus mengziensis]
MPLYTIQLFAGLVDKSGRRQLTVTSEVPVTAEGLKSLVSAEYPEIAVHIETSLLAVNQAYASDNQMVFPSDEIALIPPVGGGASTARHSCRISDTALDIEEAFRAMEDVYCGGTVLFCGTVREFTGDKKTTHLSYEAYESMALEQMTRIARDVESEHPGIHTLQWHRVGELLPTDIAVICAAASPHRDSAFVAARTLIERLKKEVPIWKKEYFEDGKSIWQANET